MSSQPVFLRVPMRASNLAVWILSLFGVVQFLAALVSGIALGAEIMVENRVGVGSGNGCNTFPDTSIVRLNIQGSERLLPFRNDTADGHIPNYPNKGAHIIAGSDSMRFNTTATTYRVVIEMGSWDSVQGDPNSFVQRRYTHDNATDGCTSRRYRYLDFTVTNQGTSLLKLRVHPVGNQYQVIVQGGTAALTMAVQGQKTTTDFMLDTKPYLPINEPPVLHDQQFHVMENSVAGTVVGTVEATDPDGGALTYRVTGGTGQKAFAVNSTTGQITVENSSLLDYETAQSFTLQIQASDQGTPKLSTNTTIMIKLTDVEEGSQAPAAPTNLQVR